ncbi:magnesium transporter CorA family protein [Mycolicibacterium thermoresistibile]
MRQVRGRIWRSGEPQQGFEFAALRDHLADADTLVWVDIYDPDHAAFTELADDLGLNLWAVEDAVAEAERTKATVYPTHTFFTVYAVTATEPDGAGTRLTVHRISAFVLPQALITVRLPPDLDVTAVSRRFDELGGQHHGVGSLLHALLDVVVDGHFAAIQVLDDAIEGLEDDLFSNSRPSKDLPQRTFQLRKDLVLLRRVVLPMREVVSAIQRHRVERSEGSALEAQYTDLYDHVLRAAEWTESLRDMVTTVFETNLSLQDAWLNSVMKKLTGWAAIIAIPTAITGFYGQNVQYPGIGTVGGFVASTVIIVLLVAILYLMFRRRNWL